MRIRTALRALIAAAALAAVAGQASAAPSIMLLGGDDDLGVGQFMIENFDDPIASGFTFEQLGGAYVRSGALGLHPGVSAPPPGTTSNYETILTGGRAMLTSLAGLSSISFYMGSPDSYNTVRFSGDDGFVWTLNGSAIWAGVVPANGSQSTGLRINYDFGDAVVRKAEFFSTGNSFEFDSIAGRLAGGGAVPEPSTWAMMILGFGAIGAVLRRRRLNPALV